MNPAFSRLSLSTLGIFRLLLGAYLILDWVKRWLEYDFVYHPQILSMAYGDYGFSLFRGVNFPSMQAFLFCALLVSHLLYFAGWRADRLKWITLVGFASLLHFNFRVQYEGDALVLFLLLWSAFLPVGARWSLDSLYSRPKAIPSTHVQNWAVAALRVQVLALFFVGFIWRLSNSEGDWLRGTALYYGVRYDCTAWGLSAWIQDWPIILTRLVTWLSFAAWSLAPLSLATFRGTRARRLGVVGLLLATQGLFTASAYMGDFFLILVPALLLFLEEGDLSGRPTSAMKIETASSSRQFGLRFAVVGLGVVQLFSLAETYASTLQHHLPQAIATTLRSLSPSTLVRINHQLLASQYWRMQAFAPRYDTTFIFTATTTTGARIDLRSIVESFPRWKALAVFPVVSPDPTLAAPNTSGRQTNRLVYNFLWYLRKTGSAWERDRFADWLKLQAEARYSGLRIAEIYWDELIDVTPSLDSPSADRAPPQRATIRSWRFQ